MIAPHPTIEITATAAYLHMQNAGIFQPLKFEWPNYPDAFAAYMNELQLGNVEVTRLRLVEEKT